MVKLFGMLACLLLQLAAVAQEIRGTVKDTTGKAVPYASINLRKKAGDAVVAYTTTDSKGGYALKLPSTPATDSLYIEARCIGYKMQSKPLTGLPADIDFALAVSVNELRTVVVHSVRPLLRSNGDTLKYKAADFSSTHDRVIADVLKRLPGITVADDGTISYNNKQVSGVYIGGDNLLDDKYGIATNSIPQGVVDEIQVINNHQPIKALQHKVASNDVAINLTFKNSAKLHLFGQESVGAGLPGNYNEDVNAMLFNAKYKGISYLKANNTGDDLWEDVTSHNSSRTQELTGDVPPQTMLSMGVVNNPALARIRYFAGDAGALNTNSLVNFKSGLQLRLNAYYIQNKQQQDYSQLTTIFLPGDTVQYAETQHNRFNPSTMRAQFTANINKEKYYLNNAFVIDDSRANNFSSLNTNGTVVGQALKNYPLSFSNEFNTIWTTKRSHVIEAYSFLSHIGGLQSLAIGPDYNAALFNHGLSYTQLAQAATVPTWFTNNYLSYKIPGRFVTQSFKAGFSVQSQQLSSSLNALQLNSTSNLLFDSAVNHVSWNNRKTYIEADYDIPGNKLKGNLSLPFIMQNLDYADTGYLLNKSLRRVYFNPQLNLKYQTGKETEVNLQYNYTNDAGSVEDIYQGYILKDYRTLYANSADLTLRQNQQLAAGFNYRKAIKLFFFNVYASYNNTHTNNIASSIITNSLMQSIVLPYSNNTGAWMIGSGTSKYSFKLHTTFSAVAQWQQTHSVQLLNGTLLPFYTIIKRLSLGAETRLNDKLNFSYHVAESLANSQSAATQAAIHINQLTQQGSIYYEPAKDWLLKLSGEHYFTRQKDNADLQYFFADASLKYRIDKWNTDLQLEATNLLNLKTYNAVYLSANTLTANSYTLPGRIILLKFLFNL